MPLIFCSGGKLLNFSNRAEPWVIDTRWHGQGWRPSVRSVIAICLVGSAFTLKIYVCRLFYPWCSRHVNNLEAGKNCEKFAFFAAHTVVFVFKRSWVLLVWLPSCDFMIHLSDLIAQQCNSSAWRCPVLLGRSHRWDPLLTRLLLLLAEDVLFFHLPETICCCHASLVSLEGTHMNVTDSFCFNNVCSSHSARRSESEIPLFVLLILHQIALTKLAYLAGGRETCLSFRWILALISWVVKARKTAPRGWRTLTLLQLSFETSLPSGTLYSWHFDRVFLRWAIRLLSWA